jgi:hypothetical protein
VFEGVNGGFFNIVNFVMDGIDFQVNYILLFNNILFVMVFGEL